MTEVQYRGATITLGTDEYWLRIVHADKRVERVHQYGNNIPFDGETLEESATLHVDDILDRKANEVALEQRVTELEGRVTDTEDGVVELGTLISEVLD